MPFINLIQEQRMVVRRNEVRARAGFFAFAGFAVLGIGACSLLQVQKESLRGEEARLTADLQRLRPIVNRIEANEKLVSELRPKLETLEQAQEMTDRWIQILTHFTLQTPESTWLTAVRSNGQDATKPVTLTLVGMSKAQEPVGEFMMRTQNEPNLEKVELKYTAMKPSPAGPAIEFEIGAEVKGTAPDAVAEEKK